MSEKYEKIPDGFMNKEEEDESITIPGIDTKKGITNLGDIDIYKEFLGHIFNIIDDKITYIENCISSRDIESFTLMVHSLKTTCRMIGAAELAEGFYTLERLGDDNDLEKIKSAAPGVLSEFGRLKTYLEPFASETEDTFKKVYDEDELLNSLKELINAAEEFDAESCDKCISRIKASGWDGGLDNDIQRLVGLVADFEYYEVQETALAIIKKIEGKQTDND